nr:RcOsp7 [Ceratobasidium cereale]
MLDSRVVSLVFVSGGVVLACTRVREEIYVTFNTTNTVLCEFRKLQMHFILDLDLLLSFLRLNVLPPGAAPSRFHCFTCPVLVQVLVRLVDTTAHDAPGR